MPKVVYENFLNGMSSNNRAGSQFYSDNRDVSIHKIPGYAVSGEYGGTKVSSAGGVLNGLIVDSAVDPSSNNIYAVDSGKLYKITNAGTTFQNSNGYPHTVSGGIELIFYNIGGTNYLFYIQSADMGQVTFGSPDTFDDDWLSTIPAGAASLSSNPHPKVEWQSMLWIGDGRYVSKLDGQTGANGTFSPHVLDLGIGWQITNIITTENYLIISAWISMSAGSSFRTVCKTFFWDGVSDTYNYSVPIEDNKIVSSFNDNGKIFLITIGREVGSATLRKLTPDGTETIFSFSIYLEGTKRTFSNTSPNIMDIFNNKMVFGLSDGSYRHAIFSYGTPEIQYPVSISTPSSSSVSPNTNGNVIGMVRHLISGSLFISYLVGSAPTTYYWEILAGNSVNAYLKCGYTDSESKVRINYIKFYSQPLASGDVATLSIDTDYGTSNSLGTMTYSTDGAITQKRFNKSIICHSFRPAIVWTGGAPAFSKIVVDYDFVTDV